MIDDAFHLSARQPGRRRVDRFADRKAVRFPVDAVHAIERDQMPLSVAYRNGHDDVELARLCDRRIDD